jgi:hypothetical protein
MISGNESSRCFRVARAAPGNQLKTIDFSLKPFCTDTRQGYRGGICRIHKKFLRARDKLAKLFCGRKISEVIVEEAAKK